MIIHHFQVKNSIRIKYKITIFNTLIYYCSQNHKKKHFQSNSYIVPHTFKKIVKSNAYDSLTCIT